MISSLFIASWYFYVLPCFLFLVDSCLFFLYEQQWTYALLSFFVVYIFTYPNPLSIALVLTLSALESFLFYGIFGLSLIYLIPFLIVAYNTHHMLYMSRAYPPIIMLFFLIIQAGIIEPYALDFNPPIAYTIGKIFVTITSVWLFSLTLKNIRQNKTIT